MKVWNFLHEFLKLVVSLVRPHRFQIGARTENVPFASQDGGAQRVVRIEFAPGTVHAEQHARTQCVLRLGAIEGYHKDRAVTFNETMVGVHGISGMATARWRELRFESHAEHR